MLPLLNVTVHAHVVWTVKWMNKWDNVFILLLWWLAIIDGMLTSYIHFVAVGLTFTKLEKQETKALEW